jgi:hypothetical protein
MRVERGRDKGELCPGGRDWLSAIRRAPKTGAGGFETIATGAKGEISDLVVDACNVYWMASGASRVLARGK